MKRKNDSNEMEMLELPVKELTLEQLHLLKVIISNVAHCDLSRGSVWKVPVFSNYSK